MPRYVALLRGVSPMNAKMAELRSCFEAAGFTNVKTVLSSGNVVFDTSSKSDTALARDVEVAMTRHLGRTFYTIVRRTSHLREIIEADPYSSFHLPASAKRVVTFLRKGHDPTLSLPIESDGVHILITKRLEVFSAYLPNPRGAVFMTLIEKTLGSEVTTRTWDTVKKCAYA
jgi:uncharacterized protein (DUF1697 family)